MVWDPKRVTRATWGDALAFYRNLEDRNPDFQPLRELVEHVGRQPYAASLGAATSGTALLVAPRDTVQWGESCLRVDIDLSGAVQLTKAGGKRFPPAERSLEAAFDRALAEAGWA
jgi:hypothetical protein